MSGGGDSSRVPIPNNARKSIQEIKKTHPKYTDDFIYTILKDCNMSKNESVERLNMIHVVTEIAGKHSFDDVYTMLKEFNMDPNESAQRLLYIDTFHEVKKKDRRKNIRVDTSEDFRQTRGNQWRGVNGGRGTYYSSNASDDAGGGRNTSSGRENGASNRLERVSRPTLPAHSEKKNNVHVAKSDAIVNNSIPAMPNGSYMSKLVPKRSTDIGGGRNVSSARENGAANHPEKVLRQPLPIQTEKVNNAALMGKSDGNLNGKPAMPSYLSKLVPKGSADVSSSSQITKHICPVGTINCEIVRRSVSRESNGGSPIGVKSSANEVASGINPVIPEAPVAASNTRRGLESNVAEKVQIPVSVEPTVSSIQNGSHVVNPSLDNNQPPQLVNEPLKVPASVSGAADSHEEKSELKISSAPKVDVMVEEKVAHQAVIFPDHLQVPENYRGLFTFGSLDEPASVDDSSRLVSVVTESCLQNAAEVVTAQPSSSSSSSNEGVSPTAQEGEFEDHLPPQQISEPVLPSSEDEISSVGEDENTEQQLVSTTPTEPVLPSSEDEISSVEEDENTEQLVSTIPTEPVLPSDDEISCDSPPPHVEEHHNSKMESSAPSTTTAGGFQNPLLQPPTFGAYIPHMIAPHFLQVDVPEHLQGGSSEAAASVMGPTTTTTQAAVMAGQGGSIALSLPPFPYYRPPPYPTTYMPYNPYFPHIYLPPQTAHLLNHHALFPTLQPPTPTGGNVHLAGGGKFPASQYKQASNEDPTAASQPKENNNTHSPVQQVDDPQVWGPAGGRDAAPILVPNYFYNFPPPQGGQHMAAFSPLHAGLYHSSSQTMTAAQSTTGQQPLVYPPPSLSTTGNNVEQPPPGSYQQQSQQQNAPQNHSNSALPNREAS